MRLHEFKNLATAIESVEHQEREFLRLYHQTVQHVRIEHNLELEKDILMKLDLYAMNHLTLEEEILKHLNHPDYTAHLNQHNAFKERLQEFKFQHSYGNVILLAELQSFMQKWTLLHICPNNYDLFVDTHHHKV